jgi:hypothetical protein
MMRKYLFHISCCICLLAPGSINAQSLSINTDGSTADGSAMLDIKGNTKGLLIPRLTSNERVGISNPATSLLIYQTDVAPGYYFNAGTPSFPAWVKMVNHSENFWQLNGIDIYNTNIGYVGIGTNTPLARLHVVDSTVIFSAPGQGNFTPGYLAVSGAGRRMIWYAHKAAFRVGYVAGNKWDEDSIGTYSVSLGFDNKATQFCSFALGHLNTATADNALALGSRTTATGIYSTAMGRQTTASGAFASTAIGLLTTASGESSTAMGRNTIASGYTSTAAGGTTVASGLYSTAMGSFSTASGDNSMVIGYSSVAAANYSAAIGESVTANSWNSISLGRHNDTIVTVSNSWILTEPLLIVGNGTGALDKKNALVILKNGNIGVGINAPNAPLAFTNVTGKKISLYESAPNSQYGFAIQGGQLQMYSDAAAAKLSFGYYNSGIYTERMYLDNSTGILNVAGTNYPSDTRYKKQIMLLQDPLKKIKAINGVEYFLRTDEFPSKNFSDKLQIGLLAQEVEKVVPQVVYTGTDGYKAIDYAKMVPLLVEAIKEQQRQIDEMKKQLDRGRNK